MSFIVHVGLTWWPLFYFCSLSFHFSCNFASASVVVIGVSLVFISEGETKSITFMGSISFFLGFIVSIKIIHATNFCESFSKLIS